MPTSVHLPKKLLDAADRRAKALGMSRNRLIIRALERELAAETAWSRGFFEKFTPLTKGDAKAVDEMVNAIRQNRRSKKPLDL